MPELPEVETIRTQLEDKISGKTIKEIIVKDARIIKEPSLGKFKSGVKGKKIKEIIRRGKVLVLKLAPDGFLIFHLRISGWIRLSQNLEPFARVIFKLSNSSLLNFCDSRLLGEIRLIDNWQEMPFVKKMGQEPLLLTKDEFLLLFENKKTKIKALLMDQSFIAGIGNIYAQEILFCAGVHPERTADKLDEKELEKIFNCMQAILKKAVAEKGSSIDRYQDIEGSAGRYAVFHKVYQRHGKPCCVCKTPLQRKEICGRGTCFCAKCQR